MAKPAKRTIDRGLAVPVVAVAAIASPLSEGRLAPLLFIDTTARPELAHLIRIHKNLPPGDVRSQWGTSRDDPNIVLFVLEFSRPMELETVLRLSISRQATVVESILTTGILYLQSGRLGDTAASTWGEPRLVVQIPESGFREYWDPLVMRRTKADVAKRLGISKRSATPLAQQIVESYQQQARLPLVHRGDSANP